MWCYPTNVALHTQQSQQAQKECQPGSTPSTSLHINTGSAWHISRGHATYLHPLLTVHSPKHAIKLARLSTAPSQTCLSMILGPSGTSSFPGLNANPQPDPLPLRNSPSTVPSYLTYRPLLPVHLRIPLP